MWVGARGGRRLARAAAAHVAKVDVESVVLRMPGVTAALASSSSLPSPSAVEEAAVGPRGPPGRPLDAGIAPFSAQAAAVKHGPGVIKEDGREMKVELLKVLEKVQNYSAEEVYMLNEMEGLSLRMFQDIDMADGREEASTSGRPASAEDLEVLTSGYKAAVNASLAKASSRGDPAQSSRWLDFYLDVVRGVDPAQLQKQMALEVKAVETAAQRYQKLWGEACERGATSEMGPTRDLVLKWFGPLRDAIQYEQESITKYKANPGRNKQTAEPYLMLLDPERLAIVTISSALGFCLHKYSRTEQEGRKQQPGTCRLARVSQHLGKVVQAEAGLLLLKAKITERLRDLHRTSKDLIAEGGEKSAEHYALKRVLRKVNLKEPQSIHSIISYLTSRGVADDFPHWDLKVHGKVGMKLIGLLMKTATVGVDLPDLRAGPDSGMTYRAQVPAFGHEYISTGMKRGIQKRTGHLVCTDALMGVVDSHLEVFQAMHPKYLPMVVPPVPWTSRMNGGYLTHRTMVMRIRGSDKQRRKLQEADEAESSLWRGATGGQDTAEVEYEGGIDEGRHIVVGSGGGLDQLYDALNSLGTTAWQINGPVLDTVTQVWEGGETFDAFREQTDLPMRKVLPLGEPLSPSFRLHSSPGSLSCSFGAETTQEAADRLEEEKRRTKTNRSNYSDRCDFLYKLNTAQSFRDEQALYYPHNVDFRGRAYPMHPYLNHLGSDVCRSMLRFSEGKPLGDRGLSWLFIHLANLFGHNKLTLAEREAFGRENVEAILDSSRDPLGGSRWWSGAESPYQCLATCHEITHALASPSPEAFLSRQPVHQDGSCNGLQHYAALSRDEEGARAVNLLPASAPQDVYNTIAGYVAEAVEGHARDPRSKHHLEALALEGQVDRKLVKQTVMTSVYGVTFVGARQQIFSRLRERGWLDNHETYRASKFAAQLTMAALERAFRNAKQTMTWLGDCASVVSNANEPVSWTTPLGLPVVQPYRRRERQVVVTFLQRMVLEKHNENLPVNKQRQRTAFPPNYVHSLDSSHLLLTASECNRQGLTFAGVHDSYWTHAQSVDDMGRILRGTFVELHSQPLLEILLQEFQEAHPGVHFPEMPKKGSLDLADVTRSTYFFS